MSNPTHTTTLPSQNTGISTPDIPAPQYGSQQSEHPNGITPVPSHPQTNEAYSEKAALENQSQPITTHNGLPPQPQNTYQLDTNPHSSPQDNYAQDKNTQNGFSQQGQYQGQNVPGAQQQQQRTNYYQSATPLASLQETPAPVDCPVCGVRELSRTEYVSGGTTHLSAALCCLCLCLGCIPYLASIFKDCEHHCGNCGALLAVWKRSGRTEVIAHARRV